MLFTHQEYSLFTNSSIKMHYIDFNHNLYIYIFLQVLKFNIYFSNFGTPCVIITSIWNNMRRILVPWQLICYDIKVYVAHITTISLHVASTQMLNITDWCCNEGRLTIRIKIIFLTMISKHVFYICGTSNIEISNVNAIWHLMRFDTSSI